MALKQTKFDAQKTNTPDTLIPVGTTITGSIETHNSIRIDGHVKGDVSAKGDVTLGPKASIEGNVCGMSFNIAGTITGNIDARGSVTVLSASKVLGDISAHTLEIALGATCSGTYTVGATTGTGK